MPFQATPLTPPQMSPLEYFAGQALAGIVANPTLVNDNNPMDPTGVGLTAKLAWALAEAMVKNQPSSNP